MKIQSPADEAQQDPPVERTPKTFERLRYCSTCKADVPATLQIHEYAGRDIHSYILRCKCRKVLTDGPVPPHIERERFSKFETFVAGGVLWRLFKAEWVTVPMNLMEGQWYFEPEFYHLSAPYSDSFRSKELAEQAILDALAGRPSLPVPAGGHSNSKSRILARLTKTAQTAMVRIKNVGVEAWSTDRIPTWGAEFGESDEDIKRALQHLRSPSLHHRAGALYWLLTRHKQGKLEDHVEEWQSSLHRVFRPPTVDLGRLFAAVAKFSAHFVATSREDVSFVWPLTCELFSSTLDTSLSKLVGARLVGRYEAAVRSLRGEVTEKDQAILPQGQDYLAVRAVYLFTVFEGAGELDVPEAVLKYLLRCACLPGAVSFSDPSAPLVARGVLTSLGVMWLVRAGDIVRGECAHFATLPGGEVLKEAFEREKTLLPTSLLEQAGVGGDQKGKDQ